MLQAAGGETSFAGQRLQFGSRQVGQRIGFQPAPGVLDRVEFRRIGRKKAGPDPRARQKKVAGTASAVGIEAVPDQQPRTLQLAV